MKDNRYSNATFSFRTLLAVILLAALLLPFLSEPALSKPSPKSNTYETLSKRPIDGPALFAITNDTDNMISWRKFAEAKIAQDPHSVEGHAVLGVVFHRAEGDLPRSRYHLEKARDYIIEDIKGRSTYSNKYSLFIASQVELIQVLGEMDRYKEKIKAIDCLTKHIPGLSYLEVEKAWPLMKLNREDEARKVLTRAFNSGNNAAVEIAWNSLGALESECGNEQAAYNAFSNLISERRRRGEAPDPTVLRNLGETCLALGRFDEAEQLFNEASNAPFSDQSYTNPYGDLTDLYISEAKFAEASQALVKTYQYSRALKPFLYQQFMADNLQTSGCLFLELGWIGEATFRLSKLVNRPDRQGGSSVDVDQAEAGNLLTWYAAVKALREYYREMLSWTPFSKSLELRWDILRMDYELWRSSSRLRALMTENGRIASSLRPYRSQGITAPECYKPFLNKILGPGVCNDAINRILRQQDKNLPVEEPYLLLHKAEIAYLFGNKDTAKKNFEKTLVTLPKAVKLVRAWSLARLAQIDYSQGNYREAAQKYAQLITSTPAAIRHTEGRVPVVCQSDGSQSGNILSGMIAKSPRFKVTNQGLTLQFYLQTDSYCASLLGPDGRVLSRAKVKLTKSNYDTAAALAKEIHEQVFAAKIA